MFKSTVQRIKNEREFLIFQNGRQGHPDVKNYKARMAMLKKIADMCADYDDGNISQPNKNADFESVNRPYHHRVPVPPMLKGIHEQTCPETEKKQ